MWSSSYQVLPIATLSRRSSSSNRYLIISFVLLLDNNNNIMTIWWNMVTPILKNRHSPPKIATSSISTYNDDNNKPRRKFRSVLSTSVVFINDVRAILASFHDLVVGILLIAFALPFFYVVGIWLGTNATFSTGDYIIEHTTIDFNLQNHRIKDETAPCGANKVRRSYSFYFSLYE